jgi:NAD+ kinase
LRFLKTKTAIFRRFGLVANPEKPACKALVAAAAKQLAAAGVGVCADASTAALAKIDASVFSTTAALAKNTDLLLVFGGDGTMLRVAREVAGFKTPMMGIKAGGLGFLTAAPSQKLREALNLVLDGEFYLESRPLIVASQDASEGTRDPIALNDFVIGRGAESRMVELEVSVDDRAITCYRCDGLIVSSPTGSTAYSLAAGGAIVCPDAEVFAITPICPHTLSNRSLIVSLDSRIQVKALPQKLGTILTADGQVQTALRAGQTVTIRRSRRSVNLLYLTGSSFFETLRQKLNWSGSNIP